MSLVFCQRHKTTNWSSSGSDFFFQKSNKVRTNFSTQKGYIPEIEFGMILLLQKAEDISSQQHIMAS